MPQTSSGVAPAPALDVADLVLNYDPEQPQARFTGVRPDLLTSSVASRLPRPVPWPAGKQPAPIHLAAAPAPDAPLASIAALAHCDAVVVTWTAAEAAALAAIFTPDALPSQWYEYRHNVESYIPLVTGDRAPFKSRQSDMTHYYHSLGLYQPCEVAGKRVLLFKSGLHLDYDGPAIPVRKLMIELACTLKPKLFITTGTGGGIGAETRLGDVVVGSAARFDCQQQFKTASWAGTGPFTTSAVPPRALALMTPSLLSVNAADVVGGRSVPKVWHGAGSDIVTTDFFAFDDSSDTYGLQGKGRACDMGDAMVGSALTDRAVVAAAPGLRWHAVRNASDPQIPDAGGDVKSAEQTAGQIYLKYGAFTTAASAIATWALIASM